MASLLGGSLQKYAITKTPNSEILDDTTTGGPALPTMSELDPPISSTAKWMWRTKRSPLLLPNGDFYQAVRLNKHLHSLLADPASNGSDVYVVTRAERLGINPAGSLHHWSFYTQGVFYHLSAPDLPRDDSRKSQNATKSKDAACRLRHENLSNVSAEDHFRLRGPSRQKLLLAYKVGQTDYRSDQILKLAEWAVHQMPAYSLLSANCQHFTTIMVQRTLMRVADRSAFAGTAIQIVGWDLSRGDQPHVDSVEHGFVVAPPLPINQNMWGDMVSTCNWLFTVHGYRDPGTIRILYEKGPDAYGAWHPPGYHTKRIKEACKKISSASTEFREDLLHGHWKDALYGRYQQQPDGTRKRPLQRPRMNDVELTTVNVHPQQSLGPVLNG